MRIPLVKQVRYLLNEWRYGLTDGGRYLVIGLLASGAFGSITLFVPIYILFCILLAVLVTALLTGLALRPSVRIDGSLPEKITAGQPLHAEFRLSTRSRRPLYDVGLALSRLPAYIEDTEPARTLPHLAPVAAASFPVTLRARKRGSYHIPAIRAYTTFPFNLLRSRGRKHPLAPFLVLPSFHPIQLVDLPLGRRYQPGGIALTSDVGESPEYIGSREYHDGDSCRRIDFRSWARLARPAVKEFQEEYYCRLALVVDTFVAPGRKKSRDGFPELEAAISLTAAAADALSRGEYIIDLFAAGPELYVFRAGRHIAHLDNILEILACVEECRTNPFEIIAPAIAAELANVTSVICVFLDWDALRAAFVRTILEAGSAARVLIVRDGPTSEPWAPDEDWAGPISVFTPADVAAGRIEQI